MGKSNLYICGDSFVDWDVPKIHWTDYLKNHYNVVKLGKYGADNHSIIYQTGRIPDYNMGDRLIIVFTAPGRFPRRYFGDRESHLNVKYLKWEWYKNKYFAKELMNLREKETINWLNGERNDEIFFLKKIKKFYKEFNPILVTWNDDFYNMTSDFVELIQVTSIANEGGESIDWHPGWKGCYDFYTQIHKLLDCAEELVKYDNKVKNLL